MGASGVVCCRRETLDLTSEYSDSRSFRQFQCRNNLPVRDSKKLFHLSWVYLPPTLACQKLSWTVEAGSNRHLLRNEKNFGSTSASLGAMRDGGQQYGFLSQCFLFFHFYVYFVLSQHFRGSGALIHGLLDNNNVWENLVDKPVKPCSMFRVPCPCRA